MKKPLGLCLPCLFQGDLDSVYLPPTGSLTDMGMLLTWEKVVPYLPKPLDIGNLRDGHEPSQLLLPNQTFRILPLCFKPTQGCQKCDRSHRDARWIGGLTKVPIYPAYTIHCKKLWSMPAPVPGSSGIRW